MLAGDAYRKLGPDAYGDPRFRRVLAKACGVDTDNQPVPDKLIVTVARLAMVEVVVSSFVKADSALTPRFFKDDKLVAPKSPGCFSNLKLVSS